MVAPDAPMRGTEQAHPILKRERVAVSCLAVIQLAIVSSPALAGCPESTLLFSSLGPLATTEQTFDISSPDGSWIRGDHRIGRFSLHHSGSLAPTVITARDRFNVTGVPPGTKLDVILRFLIEGWTFTNGCGGTGCCGLLVATIRVGPDTASINMIGHTFGGRADFSGAVEVPISLTAGTPRNLEVEMSARRCAGGAHTVDATGRIVFVGTDENALVVSCKGFGPIAVPVRQTSWGRLKMIYR